MPDEDKAKSAKDRLKAAKRAAEDAEVVAENAGEDASKRGAHGAPDARAAKDAPEAKDAPKAKDAPAAKDAPETKETPEAKSAGGKAPAPAGADPASSEKKTAGDAKATSAEKGEPPEMKKDDDAKTAAQDDETEAGRRDKERAVEEQTAAAVEDDHDDGREEGHEADEDRHGRSLSAIVLQWLAIFLIGAAAALWAGPRIAPNLPDWAAPVARFLTPGADQATEMAQELRAETQVEIAALTERLAALEEGAQDTSALEAAVEGAEARLGARIDEVANAPGVDMATIEGRIAEVAGRVTSAEAALSGLKAEVGALSGLSGESAAPSAETLERVAAFGAAVEGLRGEVAALNEKAAGIDALAAKADLAALAQRVDSLEAGEAATSEARSDAATIRREANLDAALTRIGRALLAGEGFAQPLSDAVNLSGETAPEPLSAVAGSGAPTRDELTAGFPVAAQNGYAAAIDANAGEGFGNRFLAKLEGRLGGRPATETLGDDVGAVLSRMEARLREGDLSAARAEAAGLPPAASDAMSGWLASLERADAANAAFAEWRAALSAN